MTSYVTPKKNTAYIVYVSLEDQANAGLFKTSPTIAAGDFKVSIDGGALENLATLPTNTPSGSAMVKISLSADEMNGDNITVVCTDAAGAEWYDLVLNIQTSARQVDDLAYPATSGRSLTVAATGEASANVTLWAGVAVGDAPATVSDLPPDPLDAAGVRTAVGLATANLDTQLADLPTNAELAAALVAADDAVLAAIADVPTVAELEARTLLAADYVVVSDLPSVPTSVQNADAIWDEALAGHAAAGSTGAALSAAATAGDPWLTAVPGAYGSGTAGAILGSLPASLANTGATVTVVSAVSGGNVTVYANDTWRFTVTDAALSLSGYEALALVVKRTARQDDDEALLYLRSDGGLVKINGATPISAANGTLTNTATSFTALVAIAETVGIAAGKYSWWMKGFDTTPAPDEGLTLAVGTFTVADPGLRAIA